MGTYKSIAIERNMTLISNDGWKSWKECKCSEAPAAIFETDAKIKYEVKLKHELGEKKARIILEEYDCIKKSLELKSREDYGECFEIFAISVLHNVGYKYAYDHYIVKGSDDGKIDAIYYHYKKLTVYQIKLGILDDDVVGIIESRVRDLKRTGKALGPNCANINDFWKRLSDDNKRKDFEVKTISINSKSSRNIKPIEIYNAFFTNLITCQENQLEIELFISGDPESHRPYIASAGNDVYAFFYNAKELIELLDKAQKSDSWDSYFFDNVRGHIEKNCIVNKEMKHTAEHEPEKFIVFNNGITIMGDVEYQRSSHNVIIKNPSIINGQQTILTLKSLGKKLSEELQVLLLLKGSTDKRSIARFTNSQTKIEPINLLSINENVQKLQSDLYESIGDRAFLDIITTGVRGSVKKLKRIYEKWQIVSLQLFLQLYLSTEDDDLASWQRPKKKIAELVENDIVFDLNKAKRVMEVVIEYQNQPDNDKYAYCKLPLLYIMFVFNRDFKNANSVIKIINDKYFGNKTDRELSNIYRSVEITEHIRNAVKSL